MTRNLETVIGKAVFFIFLIHFSIAVYAQKVDYNKVIMPDKSPDMDFQEKLINLAWMNYPINENFDHKTNIAEKNVTIARWSWTDNFRLFYNFNDRSFQNENVAFTQPMYGLGISFNVGSFIALPAKTKIAKESLMMTKGDLNAQKLRIRREVIELHQKYLLSLELFKIRTQAYEDAHSTYLLVSEKFKRGEVRLVEYNESLSMHSRSQEAKAVAETDILLSKAALEELIGVPLESVK